MGQQYQHLFIQPFDVLNFGSIAQLKSVQKSNQRSVETMSNCNPAIQTFIIKLMVCIFNLLSLEAQSQNSPRKHQNSPKLSFNQPKTSLHEGITEKQDL